MMLVALLQHSMRKPRMNELWHQAGYEIGHGGTPGRAGRVSLEIQERFPPPRSAKMQVKVQSFILGAQQGLLDRRKVELGYEIVPVDAADADRILDTLSLDAEMTK